MPGGGYVKSISVLKLTHNIGEEIRKPAKGRQCGGGMDGSLGLADAN